MEPRSRISLKTGKTKDAYYSLMILDIAGEGVTNYGFIQDEIECKLNRFVERDLTGSDERRDLLCFLI